MWILLITLLIILGIIRLCLVTRLRSVWTVVDMLILLVCVTIVVGLVAEAMILLLALMGLAASIVRVCSAGTVSW